LLDGQKVLLNAKVNRQSDAAVEEFQQAHHGLALNINVH
jgi:hypothetical protein